MSLWDDARQRFLKPIFLVPFLLAACGILLSLIVTWPFDDEPDFWVVIVIQIVACLLMFTGIAWLQLGDVQQVKSARPAEQRQDMRNVLLAMPGVMLIIAALLCSGCSGYFWFQ